MYLTFQRAIRSPASAVLTTRSSATKKGILRRHRNGGSLCLIHLVLTGALSAAGCSAWASKSGFFGKTDPPAGQQLRYVTGSEPESLDPQLSTGQPEARIDMALYDGLVEYDPKTMEPIPSIAERWVVNEDATEFVFFLRHTAKFSNGDSITAKDFVYTFRRGFRPELASRTVYLGYDIKYAEAYNTGGAFVRDPTTGRFLLASDVAPTGGAGNNEMVSSLARPAFQPAAQKQKNELRKELSKKDDDVGSDSAFHRFIRSPERLIV